jgi:hypothetical protein
MATHMKTNMRRLLLVVLLATAGIGWPDRTPAQALPGPGWIPLAPEALDGLRGGYQLPSGLLLSFGIERAAWVNGELVSYLRVDIPDIANITPEQAQELSKIAQTQLVQVGPGNVFNGNGGLEGGLVIQNTLDGQDIRASTTLDVSVNTLGWFLALNAGDALRNAAFTAPGSP